MKMFHFSKLNGQGNDFVIIEDIKDQLRFQKEKVMKICDRHFGIGGDGLILVKPSKIADFKMDYYNSDGSVAEMCGNGIRCMAKFIYDKDLKKTEILQIETLAGVKTIMLHVMDNQMSSANVNMGSPVFALAKIPVRTESPSQELLDYPLKVADHEFRIHCVSMGNPHCVIVLEENVGLPTFDLKHYGSMIENHKIFPQKTNVEFVKVLSKDEISMRVWERGAGETLACGTGACACAVVCRKMGFISSDKVTVHLPGGTLQILWDKTTNDVFLEGTVEHVFDGKYYH